MSRSSSYRTAALDLRRSSADLTDLALLHRRLDAATIGASGPVATVHEDSVEQASDWLAVAAGEMTSLADECDRRAAVCDDYDARLAAWKALPLLDRLVTLPPFPPARWVVG